jgi:transcriptional regulator
LSWQRALAGSRPSWEQTRKLLSGERVAHSDTGLPPWRRGGPRHGIGVADRIRQITSGTFDVKPGSLFPALHRLEQNGFIAGEWTQSPEGRRVKAYRLTAQGRRQLALERREWARIVGAMAQVLES